MALYFSFGKTSGPKATRDYSPAPSALHGSQRWTETVDFAHSWFETGERVNNVIIKAVETHLKSQMNRWCNISSVI